VSGSNGVLALNNAQANLVGGSNVVDFEGSTGNIAELYSTNGDWDSVYGSNGVVALNNAQANLLGGNETVDLQGSSGNLLAIYGTSESLSVSAKFGTTVISGFGASDVMTFSASDFANWQDLSAHMSQSPGGNITITLDSSDTITLTALSSLSASQFKFA
jgi:hypothetical protein